MHCLYKILTGHNPSLDGKSDPCFQRFVDERVQAEITQAVGRLRSHLRPNEQLTFIFVADYDLSFLGQSIEQIPAFTLCEQAGTVRQKSRWAIWKAYQRLRERLGDKIISCTQLAADAGITKSRISQIAREFGGWDRLNRCLGLLYSGGDKRPKTQINKGFEGFRLCEKSRAI